MVECKQCQQPCLWLDPPEKEGNGHWRSLIHNPCLCAAHLGQILHPAAGGHGPAALLRLQGQHALPQQWHLHPEEPGWGHSRLQSCSPGNGGSLNLPALLPPGLPWRPLLAMVPSCQSWPPCLLPAPCPQDGCQVLGLDFPYSLVHVKWVNWGWGCFGGQSGHQAGGALAMPTLRAE